MPLDDRELDDLLNLIQNSFRVRPNQDPIYVDIADHLARVSAPQHQVVFGRRGSGKSCLLVHFHRKVAPERGIRSLYIDCDEIKRLGYPDLLIRILLMILESLPTARWTPWQRIWKRRSAVESSIRELRGLLDLAEDAQVTEQESQSTSAGIEAGAQAPAFARVGATLTTQESAVRTSSFRERKLDLLERHFVDYKRALQSALLSDSHQCVMFDDFYLIHPTIQPDVIDYVHRLLRGTNLYFKVGTVRHRTALSRKRGQHIGVGEYQDIEEVNLDRTFEDTRATQEYLQSMLDSMGRRIGIEATTRTYLNEEARLHLALASGGVPRDYLTIFVDAVRFARMSPRKRRRLTPTDVYKGASRVSYRTKMTDLRSDVGQDATPLERVFQDLLTFCLKEKKKTAFLISQSDVMDHDDEHELLLQLMDFKLIHTIESDTSAASGRSGRFEAYTLDFALFMEPRLRNIEHVRFWQIDEQRRREGLREAPVYELARARSAAVGPAAVQTEQMINEMTIAIGVADEEDGEEG